MSSAVPGYLVRLLTAAETGVFSLHDAQNAMVDHELWCPQSLGGEFLCDCCPWVTVLSDGTLFRVHGEGVVTRLPLN